MSIDSLNGRTWFFVGLAGCVTWRIAHKIFSVSKEGIIFCGLAVALATNTLIIYQAKVHADPLACVLTAFTMLAFWQGRWTWIPILMF